MTWQAIDHQHVGQRRNTRQVAFDRDDTHVQIDQAWHDRFAFDVDDARVIAPDRLVGHFADEAILDKDFETFQQITMARIEKRAVT